MDSFLSDVVDSSEFLECLLTIYEDDSFPQNSTIIIPNDLNVEYIHETLYSNENLATAKRLLDKCIFTGYYPELTNCALYRKNGKGIRVTDGKIVGKAVVLCGEDDDLRVAVHEADVIFDKPAPLRKSKHTPQVNVDLRKLLASNLLNYDSNTVAYVVASFLEHLQEEMPSLFNAVLPLVDGNPFVTFMIVFQPNNEFALFPEKVYTSWFNDIKNTELKVSDNSKYEKILHMQVLSNVAEFVKSNEDMRNSCLETLKVKRLLSNLIKAYKSLVAGKYHFPLLSSEAQTLLTNNADKLVFFDELRYFAFLKNIKTLRPLSKCDFTDFFYFDTNTDIHNRTIAKFINSSCCMYIKPTHPMEFGGMDVGMDKLNYNKELCNVTRTIWDRYGFITKYNASTFKKQLRAAVKEGIYTKEQAEVLFDRYPN
jgi:hypothetical protein